MLLLLLLLFNNYRLYSGYCLIFQDTSRFKFPMTLDMAPYCEAGVVKGDSIYELFSVVIHSGSTHSGHYTAFIRDVEDLGVWSYPVSKGRGYLGRGHIL